MTWTREDYEGFRGIDPSARLRWLQARFPAGVPVHWWFFVTEMAEVDLSRFQDVGYLQRRASLSFAITTVDLALTTGRMPPYMAISIKARVVRRALQTISVDDLPDDAKPGHLISEAISCMPLSMDEALRAAERRRSEAIGNRGAFHTPDRQATPLPLPTDEGVVQLGEIEYLLAEIEPLTALAPADESLSILRQWLRVKSDF